MQYNTIQYNTIQYNTIKYNTIQKNTIHYNTIQYNRIQYNTMQYNTIQYNTIQYNTIQYNTSLDVFLKRTFLLYICILNIKSIYSIVENIFCSYVFSTIRGLHFQRFFISRTFFTGLFKYQSLGLDI